MRNLSLTTKLCSGIGVSLCVVMLCTLLMAQQRSEAPPPSAPPANNERPLNNPTRLGQLQEEADAKSTGCVACHGQTDSPTMHTTNTLRLGCTDFKGGDPNAQPPAGAQPNSAGYDQAKKQAHPKPKLAGMWRGSANPVRPYVDWMKESKEYIRFVNPGDL